MQAERGEFKTEAQEKVLPGKGFLSRQAAGLKK
jgi:hypothetical protein